MVNRMRVTRVSECTKDQRNCEGGGQAKGRITISKREEKREKQ